jgi:hypothetical protein
LLAGWLTGWLGLLVFFGRPASQQTPKTFDIKRKKKIKRVDISSSTQLYPLSLSLNIIKKEVYFFFVFSFSLLDKNNRINSPGQADESGHRSACKMALTFGLSGGKILSLSLFSLSRIFSLGGKKKKQKTTKTKSYDTSGQGLRSQNATVGDRAIG